MVNIVMLIKDRAKLTEQAINSLRDHTNPDAYNLTLVDDGSKSLYGAMFTCHQDIKVATIRIYPSKCIVGFARNLGINFAEHYWGRGDWLYLSDNDVYFKPHWLEKMVSIMQYALVESYPLKVLGGYRHPFHGVNHRWRGAHDNRFNFDLTDAVAGYSQLMTWHTWDKFGPFDAHAKGVCQSEDFAFCQRLRERGYVVGYTAEPVIYNCGLTNSEGKPAVGRAEFDRSGEAEGVIYE